MPAHPPAVRNLPTPGPLLWSSEVCLPVRNTSVFAATQLPATPCLPPWQPAAVNARMRLPESAPGLTTPEAAKPVLALGNRANLAVAGTRPLISVGAVVVSPLRCAEVVDFVPVEPRAPTTGAAHSLKLACADKPIKEQLGPDVCWLPPTVGDCLPRPVPALPLGAPELTAPRASDFGVLSGTPHPSAAHWRDRLVRSASWTWEVCRPYARWLAGGLTTGCLLWIATTRFPARDFARQRWLQLQEAVANRAAIELSEDFRAGFAAWEGPSPWQQTWKLSYDGYVLPGRLALYKPSMGMQNYRLEFLAQIERNAVSWVYRAQDTNHYYAAKIRIVQPGPLPALSLVRYAVIAGKAQRRTEIPVRVVVQNGVPCAVTCVVRGSTFTTLIAGEVVDVWTDSRLQRGGVGFFADAGERARLYWVKVSHQDDLLGKLCAYLRGPASAAYGRERSDP